ncbi:MAG: hypothetical protein P8X98_17270 [Woeseiaceae bacterium]
MSYRDLKQAAWEANMELQRRGLVSGPMIWWSSISTTTSSRAS